ncbi:hypothetical protein HIM_04567 [Hirsutella minnesotensis 3608]|uniref:Copper acquisition factor BIM1-like domain-containing protein n=1 Tax=Hirsutella minnesotensis 3608 TaxID=1043627 RepID=A0A0F7ZL84_9HYPO|nr:hypothetical protein HIM_04567 [Hirsutella minnesotensis 3608]
MLSRILLATAVLAVRGALGHFALSYPAWRADTLSEEGEAKYSQWAYPCAGVDYGVGNVTDWPLDGGSLKLELHHAWTYVFVNLGLGRNATNFNVSLTPEFLNTTGRGELCIDKLPVPIKVQNGSLASLQVVTTSASGAALYNCADIRFVEGAKTLSNCSSTSVKSTPVREQKEGSNCNSTGGSSGSGGQKSGAVSTLGSVSSATFMTTMALTLLFALGIGL